MLKDEKPYCFTLFYGFADSSERYKFWVLLHNLEKQSMLPWVMLGNFNKLIFANEKQRRVSHSKRLIEEFKLALVECGLRIWSSVDIHSHGRSGEER